MELVLLGYRKGALLSILIGVVFRSGLFGVVVIILLLCQGMILMNMLLKIRGQFRENERSWNLKCLTIIPILVVLPVVSSFGIIDHFHSIST